MKKFLFGLVLFQLFLSAVNIANADCSTGFACSISDLEKIEQQNGIEFIYVMNKYFNRDTEEPVFLDKSNKISNYQDLFIYNVLV